MTPRALLASLHAARVEVVPTGSNLRLRGPDGALTPELLAVVKEHKATLLRLLAGGDPGAAPGTLPAEPENRGPAADSLPEPRGPACGHDEAVVLLEVEGQGTLCSRCWRRWIAGNISWPGSPGSEVRS